MTYFWKLIPENVYLNDLVFGLTVTKVLRLMTKFPTIGTNVLQIVTNSFERILLQYLEYEQFSDLGLTPLQGL